VHQKDKIYFRLFIEVIDEEWDNYEVGSSFVIEEPFSAPNLEKIKYAKYGRKNDSTIYWDANKKGKKDDNNRSRDGRSTGRKYAAKIQAMHLGGKRRSPNKPQCVIEIPN